MKQMRRTAGRGRDGERGSIMVMTAVLMTGLVLAVGICIDVARFYMVRAELQNAADAAALAAARDLNSSVGGLADAYTRATTVANSYNFTRTNISIAKVEFAINLDGPYTVWNPNNPITDPTNALKDARFVRVTTQAVSLSVLFSGAALGSTHDEVGVATAGMSIGLNRICNFYPIAVALTNINPAPGTLFSFRFTDGTGSTVTIPNGNYVVLDVPDITGNGSPETANLSAGITGLCYSLGDDVPFNQTPSANSVNGPKQIEDGTNTRFDVYAHGYSNDLIATTYPPDTNVREGLTATQYLNRSPLTTPPRNPPGQDDRRILVMPIIAPQTNGATHGRILNFMPFVLRNKVDGSGACKSAGTCGNVDVEVLPNNYVIGRGYYDPAGGTSTSLTVPILYK